MPNQQLVDYIQKARVAGNSDKEISNALLNAGWQSSDIENAFAFILQPAPSSIAGLPLQNGEISGSFALIKNSFKLYKSRFFTFTTLSALPGVTLVTAFFLKYFFILESPKYLFLLKPSVTNSALFLWILLYFWSSIALIFAIKDGEKKIGVIQSYREGLRKLFPGLLVIILFWLAVLGGSFLLIIPAIFVFVWFGFAIFALIEEDASIMNVFLKSREYARGKLSKIFWRYFVMMVFALAILIVMAVSIFILSAIVAAIALFGFGVSWMSLLVSGFFALIIILSLFGFIYNTIATPLLLSYAYLLYKSLKSAKGEFAFAPTKKIKATMILFISIGLLLFGVLIYRHLYMPAYIDGEPAPYYQNNPTILCSIPSTDELLIGFSKSSFIKNGFSIPYFNNHMKFNSIEQTSRGDKEVIWDFTVGEYQTAIRDRFNAYAFRESECILSAAGIGMHKIENVLPKMEAEQKLMACLTEGFYVGAPQEKPSLYYNLENGNLYLKSRIEYVGGIKNASINLETGECSVGISMY